MTEREPVLWTLAVLHALLAVACVASLAFSLSPIGGLHPAIKPLKFAIALALMLGTLAYVTPKLGTSGLVNGSLIGVLAVAVLVEIVIIVAQAIRGQPSHFNTGSPLDRALWFAMMVAAVAIAVASIGFALAATVRPLAMSPLLAVAVRVGLWLVVLTAVSGFAMGGSNTHAVGGPDGSPGIPLAGWSRSHGDLRVPHFFALHGLQALPLLALALEALPIPERARWVAILGAIAGWIALAIGTLVQALVGRPFVG